MAKRKGYVSSFDRQSGFGFLRPEDAPSTKVMFRRQALKGDETRSLLPGKEVLFEVDSSHDESSPWDVAGKVEIVPADDEAERLDAVAVDEGPVTA